MSRHHRLAAFATSVVLGAAPACDGDTAAELEIIDVRRTGSEPVSQDDPVSLEVQVRNNGSGSPTVGAAVVGDLDSGLIRRGPAQTIRGGETESLELQIPAAHPYLQSCRIRTPVFLATTGDPPNIITHTWTDDVPENHVSEFSMPVERPVPVAIDVVEPIREVVEEATDRTYRRHYEAEARMDPEGSRWAVSSLTLQTQDAFGIPVEAVTATLTGTRLTSETLIWTGAQGRRDSVSRGTILVRYRDCAGGERELLEERLSIQLAPR